MTDSQRNEWSLVNKSPRVKKATKRQTPKFDVREFLSKYKTEKCPIEDFHDVRTCSFFHDETDRRRDPYKEFFLPEDSTNPVEKMYHPALFRTNLCKRGVFCPFTKSCSFAHDEDDLRCYIKAQQDYDMTEVITRQRPTLGTAVSAQLSQKSSKRTEILLPATFAQPNSNVPGTLFHFEEFLPVDPKSQHWFMINYDPFFSFLEEKALEDGLSRVSGPGHFPKYNQFGLQIVGPNADELLAKFVSSLLDPQRRFFIADERPYSGRVIEQLEHLLGREGGKEKLLGQLSDSAFLEVLKDAVKVCAKNGKGYRGDEIVKLVFEKIDFWVGQVGYDCFLDCAACFEARNKDEGILCPNHHFFCSVAEGKEKISCVGAMVKSQLPSISAQGAIVICAVCNAAIEMQQLARRLAPPEWKEVHDAVLDAKVRHTEETLAKQFDQRLEARIKEFMDRYEFADERVKVQAVMIAQRARNEALNLKCPHCQTVYAEFTGCMALMCESCKQSFCAYCHKACSDSRGTHEHVRVCDMNETDNGSYYASTEQIKRGQKKFRIKQLKKFLREHKKEIQNATIIELQQDLDDLGIDPAALFEFGNLLPEIPQD